jgi:methylamine dehydrogenase light chain
MRNLIESLLGWMDRSMELGARSAARTHGRRRFLTRLGAMVVGGSMLPMLPFDSSIGAGSAPESDLADDTKCDYWAYCSLDGTRCNACGGSISQCPPGSQASKVSWVGTCVNPQDKKAYLVSYYDCCGKAACRQDANCSSNEGERPGYRIGSFNDMNWCMANSKLGVHCSAAVIVGVADAD